MPLPTIDRLREVLRLDQSTGKLYWIGRRRGVTEGAEAGTIRADSRLQVRVDGRIILAHRIVFALANNRWPTATVDHRDRDGTNNRPLNLRDASSFENARNVGITSRNTSGVKGVCWDKAHGKWKPQICVNRRAINLGLWDDLEFAALVYATAAERFHGEFAHHGQATP